MAIPFPTDSEYKGRLFARVQKDDNGCWNYNGYKQKSGHGQMAYRGKTTYVHRLAYILTNGEISDDVLICHKCNNAGCIKPSHLYAGTHSTNLNDAVRAGQNVGVNGRGAATAKLTESDVLAIRSRYDKGDKIAAIHRDYPQVGYHNVGCVCRRTSWRHI